jgi:hypothetical protein
MLLQWIQTALWERHRVRTLRRTLEQIADDSVASLAADGSLAVDGMLRSPWIHNHQQSGTQMSHECWPAS